MKKKTALQKRMQAMSKTMPFKSDAEIQAWQKGMDELTKINKHIMEDIAKDVGKPVQMSWLPSKAARTSFFAPISDRDLKDDIIKDDPVKRVFESAYGKAVVTGLPLNIVDESVFLAVLYLIEQAKSPVLKINYARICKLLGISVQGKNYARIKKAIIKLGSTNIVLLFKDGTFDIQRPIDRVKGNKDYTLIQVDPWFYENFQRNDITLINMDFRRRLKGDITKCLYRFLTSHKGTQRYHTTTLIDALNMNPDRPLFKNRDSLKRAFKQLANKGFLTFKYHQKSDLFAEIKTNRKLLLARMKKGK